MLIEIWSDIACPFCYRITLCVAFFKWYIAKSSNEATSALEVEFNLRKARLNYPIFEGAYFERYFELN